MPGPTETTTQVDVNEIIAAYKQEVSDVRHDLTLARIAHQTEQRKNTDLARQLEAANKRLEERDATTDGPGERQ